MTSQTIFDYARPYDIMVGVWAGMALSYDADGTYRRRSRAWSPSTGNARTRCSTTGRTNCPIWTIGSRCTSPSQSGHSQYRPPQLRSRGQRQVCNSTSATQGKHARRRRSRPVLVFTSFTSCSRRAITTTTSTSRARTNGISSVRTSRQSPTSPRSAGKVRPPPAGWKNRKRRLADLHAHFLRCRRQVQTVAVAGRGDRAAGYGGHAHESARRDHRRRNRRTAGRACARRSDSARDDPRARPLSR